MTEDRVLQLVADWHRFTREMEKAEKAGHMRIAASYENSLARIETQLAKEDIDPRDYQP